MLAVISAIFLALCSSNRMPKIHMNRNYMTGLVRCQEHRNRHKEGYMHILSLCWQKVECDVFAMNRGLITCVHFSSIISIPYVQHRLIQ